jgi:hypothetical protein
MENLSAYEYAFIYEWLIDKNATKACRRAGYDGVYARAEGERLTKLDRVVAQTQQILTEIGTSSKPKLSVTDVVEDIARVLRADPRELIAHWQGACRYCYGYENRYQRTLNEFRDAQCKKDFNQMGGAGFNPRREPNDDCPECFGEGEPYERIKDTRELSKDAAALYLGVERTKHGTKLLMRSKDAAREAAARYLGMNKETVNHNIKNESEMTDAELEAEIMRGRK